MSFKPGVLEAHHKTAEAYRARGRFDHASEAILAEEPELGLEHHFYWNAFRKLSNSRPPSPLGGRNRIPWKMIEEFGARYNLSLEESETFIDIIECMDDVVIASDDKQESKPASGKTSRPTRPK